MIALARIVWLATGFVWAARSLVALADPHYWDPVTTLDYVAVWLFTACWLTLAPSIFLLGRLTSSRAVTVVASVVAIAALVAGVANGVEDGLDMKWAGIFYIFGSLTAFLGLLALAFTFRQARYPRLAWVSAALFIGSLLFNAGGGFVYLIALASVAVAPRWFATPGRGATGEPTSAPDLVVRA